MTHPPHLRSLTDATWEPGEVIHQSWLLAGGILPIDRHGLALERVLPGEGFDEESSSWLQRRWRHERRVVDDVGTGCTVTDHLIVEPRVALLRPVVARVVQLIRSEEHTSELQSLMRTSYA